MKDAKDRQPTAEDKTFLEKLETATPVQAAQSVIAQILQKLRDQKRGG